jgi:DNA adenine methylase Dam
MAEKKEERFIEGVMNYTGSKFKLLEQLLPEFDYTKFYFVDLFTGGGSVYTNVVDRFEKVVANDIITDLIGIHQSLLDSDSIIEETKSICPSKGNPELFGKLREDYNSNPSPSKLWALLLSSTNNMMRFNQKFKYNQTYGDRGWNNNTDKKVEIFTNHIRQYKDKIRFKSVAFDQLEISSDKIMVYADPPYGRVKNEDGSIGKKQISEAGYNAFWKEDDDIKLYNYLKSIDKVGSSFMVSGVLNHDGKTCWMLDKLIADGYRYKKLQFDYNKVSRKGDKETTEVIIMNY